MPGPKGSGFNPVMAEKKSFALRINAEVLDALQRMAAADFRSLNGQIEFILTDYVRKRARITPEEEADPQPVDEI